MAAAIPRRPAAELLVKRNLVTGATMAFRAEHRDLILPIAGTWVHDGWFALLLAAVAPCIAIDEPLIAYRQHPGQQIGAIKKSLARRFLRAMREDSRDLETIARNYEAAGRRLAEFRRRLTDDRILRLLEEKVEHLCGRGRDALFDRSAIADHPQRVAPPSLRTIFRKLEGFARDLLP